jgi:hypothetical protein
MSKDQIKEDQDQRETEEKRRAETGQMINPDELERADEIRREGDEQKRFSKDVDERDLGAENGQSYASGEADRNRGSSHTGSTDNGGAMREGTQEEKVNKGG